MRILQIVTIGMLVLAFSACIPVERQTVAADSTQSSTRSSADNNEHVSGFAATLEAIAGLAEDGDYEAIRPFLYDFTFRDRSSSTRMLDGIREEKLAGDFAFTPESFRYISEHLTFAIDVPHAFVLRDLFQEGVLSHDTKLQRIAVEEPERLLLFSYYGSDIVMVMDKDSGNWQIAFSRGAGKFHEITQADS